MLQTHYINFIKKTNTTGSSVSMMDQIFSKALKSFNLSPNFVKKNKERRFRKGWLLV